MVGKHSAFPARILDLLTFWTAKQRLASQPLMTSLFYLIVCKNYFKVFYFEIRSFHFQLSKVNKTSKAARREFLLRLRTEAQVKLSVVAKQQTLDRARINFSHQNQKAIFKRLFFLHIVILISWPRKNVMKSMRISL